VGTRAAEIRVGVVGTGFISRHFLLAFDGRLGLKVTGALTRRDPAAVAGYPRADLLTRSRSEVLDGCDVLLECSGDPVYATDTIDAALRAGLPVVTCNPEFHVTAGSWFVGRGLVTETEGDQPGALVALHRWACELGFRPLVCANIKGFRNYAPTPEDMLHWSRKQGISLQMVTAATDGTKIQVEQALVANALSIGIATPGLVGPEDADYRAAGFRLAEEARRLGRPISDYVLSPGAPHGVFLIAEHDREQAAALEYLKLGGGPGYMILRNNVFAHLEVGRMIRQVVEQGHGLLDNSAVPSIGVVALAKRALAVGTPIDRAIGSFEFRGIAVPIADNPDAVPIGLLDRVRLRRRIEPDQLVSFDDVDLPETLAFQAWRETLRRVQIPSGDPVLERRADFA
jgi:predicted homoserine dehydrogenase-like protein